MADKSPRQHMSKKSGKSLKERGSDLHRAGHEPVVIVSLDDYESLKESAYLLRSPENARRLLASIDRLEAGRGSVRDLVE